MNCERVGRAAGMPSRKVADPQHDEAGGPLQGMPKHGFPKSGKGKPPVGWMVATLLMSTGVAVVVVVRVFHFHAARGRMLVVASL